MNYYSVVWLMNDWNADLWLRKNKIETHSSNLKKHAQSQRLLHRIRIHVLLISKWEKGLRSHSRRIVVRGEFKYVEMVWFGRRWLASECVNTITLDAVTLIIIWKVWSWYRLPLQQIPTNPTETWRLCVRARRALHLPCHTQANDEWHHSQASYV